MRAIPQELMRDFPEKENLVCWSAVYRHLAESPHFVPSSIMVHARPTRAMQRVKKSKLLTARENRYRRSEDNYSDHDEGHHAGGNL